MSQGSANAAKPNGSNAINEIFSHSFPKKPVHNRLLTAASLLQADDRIALYKTGLRAMQIALRPAT